jgi:SH2 domain
MDTEQLYWTVNFNFSGTVSEQINNIILSLFLLSLLSWYFGTLSPQQAELYFNSCKTGTFLICDSGKRPGQFALFILFKNTVKQYPIRTFDLGGYFINKSLKFGLEHQSQFNFEK